MYHKELKNAEAKGEVDLVGRVHKAGKLTQHWPANMRLLESRNKEHWGKTEVPTVESKVLIQIRELAANSVAQHTLSDQKLIPQEGSNKESDDK